MDRTKRNSNVSNLTPSTWRVNLLEMHVAQLIVTSNLPVPNLPPFARRQRFASLAACSDSAAQPNGSKRLWFEMFKQLVLGSGKGHAFPLWLLYTHLSWKNSAPFVIKFSSYHHSDAHHSCCCSLSKHITGTAKMHYLGQAGGGWRHRWFLHGQPSAHFCNSPNRVPTGSDIQPSK